MKSKFFLHLSFFLLFVSSLAQAQDKDSKGRKTEGSSTIIDFGKNTTIKKEAAKDKSDFSKFEDRNAIYTDLLTFLSNHVGLAYERAITPNFSLTAGGGFTFGAGIFTFGTDIEERRHQYVMGIFAPDANKINESYWQDKGFTDNVEDFLLNKEPQNGFNSIKGAAGNFYFLEPKYFINDEVFDGMFLGARLQYLKYNYQTLEPKTGVYRDIEINYTDIPATLTKSYLDIIPQIGYEGAPYHNNILTGISGGIGVRMASIHAFDNAYKTLSNGEITHETRIIDQTNIIPVLMVNLKIGFLF